MDGSAPLIMVLAGHVDHGKSSLLGRLLHELDLLPAGKAAELAAMSSKRGVPLEWSFVLDGFQAERDQAITLDTTRVRVKTPHRELVVIDAPGHKELLKNMIGGASAASAALLVLDVQAGSEEQTVRHAYLLKLLGVRELVVAINKMDLVGYAEASFRARAREVSAALKQIGFAPRAIVPVSARDGANLRERGAMPAWYRGATLVTTLEQLPLPSPEHALALRMPIQDVYRVDERRALAGRVESGRLAVGDELVFSPSGRTARIAELLAWPNVSVREVHAGDNAAVVLDRPLVVERGDTASHREHAPKLTAVFDAEIFWLAGTPLVAGRELGVQLGVRELHGSRAGDSSSDRCGDPCCRTCDSSYRWRSRERHVARAGVGRRRRFRDAAGDRTLRPARRFCHRRRWDHRRQRVSGSSGNAGRRAQPDADASSGDRVGTRNAFRPRRCRHLADGPIGRGKVDAGDGTGAAPVRRGLRAFVLDGDNVRRGLNANLTFSPEDRQENIRRVGEVAALFAEAGMVCVTAFISPYRDDRRRARAAARDGRFFEIYVKADLASCEARDPKGLYRKARDGEIKDFTGIDSPYEEPESPELVIDTAQGDVAACVEQLLAFVVARCRI